jgi:type VI secretion system Hcp family effector
VSRSLVLAALLAAVVAVGSGSPALPEAPAADFFLKITGIEGEAEDGSIAVAGFAWDTRADIGRFAEYTPAAEPSAIVSPRDAASGMASGRRMHKPMTIVKHWDKASPVLMQACAQGDPIVDVEVWEREGGQAYLRYTLKDAFITSYSVSRDPDPTARPMESVSFSYERIEVAPTAPAERGSLNSSKSN